MMQLVLRDEGRVQSHEGVLYDKASDSDITEPASRPYILS